MECDFVYDKRLDSINIRIIDIYVMHMRVGIWIGN